MCGLTVNHQLSLGGLAEMQARTWARSTPIYQFIDQSGQYYRNKIEKKYRSRINITFRIGEGDKAEERLETKFYQEAEANEGLIGLKGHAWVGGIRITLGNAMPFEAVFTLIEYM